MLVFGAALAQNYPSRPIRIVSSEAGGGTDFTARTLANALTANWGQQVVVESRASAVMGELVANAAPDGYTLLVGGNSVWIGPLLQNMPYDPLRDLAPVILAVSSPNILVVHPALPVRSVRELIALAKAHPGELNYATSGTGSSTHLAGELFKSMTGVDITRVNYKGSGQVFNDLLGGHVQLMFGTGGAVSPHIKSGRLRALAVTTGTRSALFPLLPTLSSTVPGFEAGDVRACRHSGRDRQPPQ